MHELSVCRALLEQVTAVAEQHHANRVQSICLSIGPLSGVDPDLLHSAYAVASLGSVAEGASLTIERSPLRVRCLQCGAESNATPNHLLCGACGDYRTQLLSGDELLLTSVELATPPCATGDSKDHVPDLRL